MNVTEVIMKSPNGHAIVGEQVIRIPMRYGSELSGLLATGAGPRGSSSLTLQEMLEASPDGQFLPSPIRATNGPITLSMPCGSRSHVHRIRVPPGTGSNVRPP